MLGKVELWAFEDVDKQVVPIFAALFETVEALLQLPDQASWSIGSFWWYHVDVFIKWRVEVCEIGV